MVANKFLDYYNGILKRRDRENRPCGREPGDGAHLIRQERPPGSWGTLATNYFITIVGVRLASLDALYSHDFLFNVGIITEIPIP